MRNPVTAILSALAGALSNRALATGDARRSGAEEAGLLPVPLPECADAARPGSLTLIDVDGLASINESYGPDLGDRLIERIADVTRRAMPPGGAMERLDGGRFVLWLSSGGAPEAMRLAEELRRFVARASIETPAGRVSRTISAGVVQLSGEEGRARALMAADAALARAKRLGGDRVSLAAGPTYPSGPTTAEVQDAIHTGDLGYHVQPIFDLATGKAVGVEALLRWARGDGGHMRPSDFLHRLDRLPEEAAGLFIDLAVDAARPFVTAPDPLFVSFNVTAGALEDEDSQSRTWLRTLMTRLPAERLMLELLESAVITRPDAALAALDYAREHGARIALDDFGTGLSNLDRMLDLRPDVIKLDRMLMTGLGESERTEAMLAAMVAMADRMEVRLVAEGLETPADTELVRAMGISWGQGFHLGRPAPVGDWVDRLL